MTTIISIAELQDAGVTLRADEAVAIAQKLIHEGPALPAQPPFGPPSAANVCLCDDGSVTCRGCEMTPTVSEIAIFVQSLLRADATHVPGGLRYAIARALLDVDAPPFESLAEFSEALARYECGKRSDVIRRLIERSQTAGGKDRRRAAVSATDLRRQLREADERLYEQQRTIESFVPQGLPRRRYRFPLIATGIVFGLLVIGGKGSVGNRSSTLERVAPHTSASEVARVVTQAEPAADARAEVRTAPRAAIRSRSIVSRSQLRQSPRPDARRRLRSPSPATARVRAEDRRHKPAGVLARLRLQWLRRVFVPRRSVALRAPSALRT
jgi:hypothetical protein